MLVVVVAAVVAVPRVRAHLAQNSARALVADWLTVQAFDGQRDSYIAAVEQLAGIADQQTVAAAIRRADREEVAALSVLRRRIADRSSWQHDVAAAARLVVAALDSKVAVLRQDAMAPHPFPSLVDLAQASPVLDANDTIGRMQSRRHLETVHPRHVALPPLRREINLLRRPTDQSTGLRLITAEDGHLFAYDLDTGARGALPGDPGGAATLTVAAGTGVVATGPFGTRFLVPGRPARQLATRPADRVFAFGGEGFWLSLRDRVRAFDAAGRATTRWYAVPPNLGRPEGATQSTIALLQAPEPTQLAGYAFNESSRQAPSVTAWTPSTGWTHELHRGCALPITTIDQIIMVICPADRVFAYDVAVRQFTEHDPPDGSRPQFFAPVPSPDGRYITVQIDHGTDFDVDLLDLQTDQLIRFPAFLVSANPIEWSADGKWLLLSTNDAPQSQLNNLVLWNASSGHVMSVRLPAFAAATAAGVALV